MKKWMIFVLGLVTGFVVALLIDYLGDKKDTEPQKEKVEAKAEKEPEPEPEEDDGITFFDEPGEILNDKSFNVFLVVAKDAALVKCKSEYDMYLGTTCLIMNRERKLYYDDEIIKVPQGKVARQMGVYQYPNREGMIKTVPIIEIVDK